MINLGPATRIFLAVGSTDMRKGFNGLSDIVRHRLESDPLNGHLYVFCNKRRNRIKVMYWDGSGLWICNKRLEKGRFSWPAPEHDEPRMTLSSEAMSLLLGGIVLEKTRLKNWWRRGVSTEQK